MTTTNNKQTDKKTVIYKARINSKAIEAKTEKQLSKKIADELKNEVYSLNFICDFIAGKLQNNGKTETNFFGIKTNQVKKTELSAAIKKAFKQRAFFKNEAGEVVKIKTTYSEGIYSPEKKVIVRSAIYCEVSEIRRFTFEYLIRVLSNYGTKAKETITLSEGTKYVPGTFKIYEPENK